VTGLGGRISRFIFLNEWGAVLFFTQKAKPKAAGYHEHLPQSVEARKIRPPQRACFSELLQKIP
jgi:hypothetical protein